MSGRGSGLIGEIRDLVRDASRSLEIEPPASLFEFGLEDRGVEDWYLVGLIGGKEVGKSALINALVGERIAESTSFGPGTEKAAAYVHRSRTGPVKEFLEREIPGDYEIVEHDRDSLGRQVLLDLPDIDSHYSSHFETVRRLLRFILFPIWIQSLEKYADRQPMELLRRVLQGNAPENFLFCLNKVDQLASSETDGALAEIAEDYGARIGKAVGFGDGGKVFLLSALHPEDFDLPRLKEILSKQKEEVEVESSKALAERRFAASLLGWVRDLDLSGRVERIARVAEHLESLLSGRIEESLYDTLLPSIRGDERVEAYLFRRAFRSRIARWPILRTLDTLAGPARRLLERDRGLDSVEVRALTRETIEKAFERIDPPLEKNLQACFAHLHGSYPQTAELYADRRLWKEEESREAVADLRRRLSTAHARLLERAVERVEVSNNLFGAAFRGLVSFGALLWFPFGQPVLEHFLEEESFGDAALLLVRLFGVASLLQSALFLILFFGVVTLLVRWRAHGRANRALRDLETVESSNGGGLEDALREWGEGLAAPLREERDRLHEIEKRREELESRLRVDA